MRTNSSPAQVVRPATDWRPFVDVEAIRLVLEVRPVDLVLTTAIELSDVPFSSTTIPAGDLAWPAPSRAEMA